MGNAIYKELLPFYDVHATYFNPQKEFEDNHHFHKFDMEVDSINDLLQQLEPAFIVSSIRGNENSQLYLHDQLIAYISNHASRLIFLSSANVFDRFTNYPSYEYDKSIVQQIFQGLFKKYWISLHLDGSIKIIEE